MAMVPMYAGRSNGSTGYWPIGIGDPSVGSSSSVADTTSVHKLPGVFRRLGVNVVSNTNTTTGLVTFRVNGSDANQTITIPVFASFVAGFVQDPTNVDSPADGDILQMGQVFGTGGAMSIRVQGCAFQAAQDTVTVMGSYNLSGSGTSAATKYTRLNANGSFATEDPSLPLKMAIAGTFKYFTVNLATNTRVTSGSVMASRLNATSAGNLSITTAIGGTAHYVTAGGTTDVLAVNDSISSTIAVDATGSGTVLGNGFYQFINTNNQAQYAVSATAQAGTAFSANTTNYVALAGRLVAQATETDVNTRIGVVGTLDNAGAYAITNTLNNAATITLMVGGSPSALTISIPGSGSFVAGLIAGNGTRVPLLPTDNCDWKVATVAGGTSVLIGYMTHTLDLVADPTAVNKLATLGVG